MNQHREQLSGEFKGRPLEEVEADLFAAEVLLPPKAVAERFRATLGENIDHAQLSELNLSNLAHIGFRFPKRGSELRSFSRAIASPQRWGWNHFRDMSTYFGASPTSVAVRIEELELVR
jgi:hypothetical protein